MANTDSTIRIFGFGALIGAGLSSLLQLLVRIYMLSKTALLNYFSSDPKPVDFFTTFVLYSPIIIAAIGLGLLGFDYFRNKRHKRNNDPIMIQTLKPNVKLTRGILKFSICFIPVGWIYRIADTRSMF